MEYANSISDLADPPKKLGLNGVEHDDDVQRGFITHLYSVTVLAII